MILKKKNCFNLIKKSINKKNDPICVWGVGYIGLSTASFFAKNNKNAIGFDIDKHLIQKLNRGILKNLDFQKWLGFPIKKLTIKKKLIFTTNLNDIKKFNPKIHFICIPTEKNGKPYLKILHQVIKTIISNFSSGLIIIESTLTPGTSQKIIQEFLIEKLKEKNFFFSVAPRRDWFVDGSKNLEKMDRVFGGWDENSTELTKLILSKVCKKLHQASNFEISELVKSFENAYRHVDIALANQLSLAYPKLNVREALKLVGTKWNIGTFYPGFGSGGYCIPVSSKYVIDGSKKKNQLSILKETIKTDTAINLKIANSIINRGYKKIAILGLSYKENLKVHALSPIIPFVELLKKKKKKVSLFDPFYNKFEIKKILNIDTFNIKKDIKNFDCLIYHVNHSYFIKRKKEILKRVKCKLFLDNTGEFSGNKKFFNDKKIKYKLTGAENWI